MPQSLSQIYIHLVFGTKNRAPFLDPAIRPRLYAYTAGVLNNLGCVPMEVGGFIDHIHILCSLSRILSPAKLVEEVKKPTSKWLKTQGESFSDFHWQGGYGAFSVSRSNVNEVREYIMKQDEHHRSMDFQEEFRRLLKAHGVEFDERYVWD